MTPMEKCGLCLVIIAAPTLTIVPPLAYFISVAMGILLFMFGRNDP